MDSVLVERGFFSSRSRAAAAVLAGEVKVDGRREYRAGFQVGEGAELSVEEQDGFVSRGGLKLERAFEAFALDVQGKVVLDAGASTGGFTDCLLRHGARKVIAMDVGYGQLDWKLRQDPRVEVMEKTNIRYLEPEKLPELPEMATLDLSFISLKKVFPAVIKCLRPGYEIVALVKPQFEAGRENVGKGGVVREPATRRQVLSDIWSFAGDAGCAVIGVVESGGPGPRGNIEYLMHIVDRRGGGVLDRLPSREEELDRLFS